MFIYLITNKIDNMQYIGKTNKSVGVRFKEHLYRANCKGTVNRQYISKAISKHGKENFTVETIYEASSLEELSSKEIKFIKEFNTLVPNGYNLSKGGEGVSHTEETKNKISIKNSGKKRSRKSKMKMKFAKLGKRQTKAHIEKASEARKLGQVTGINLKDGSIIVFKCAKDAADIGFNSGHISSCIAGNRKSHKGYRWTRCLAS